MPAGVNLPVLVGAIPLFAVQSMTITEGYKIERIAGSGFSQAVAPSAKTIAIEAVLTGRERLVLKKGLELMALTTRSLVPLLAPGMAATGVPVVSAFTIALDMQITDLRFTQSATKRDAVDVSITLSHVPRSTAAEITSEALDLALAIGTAAIPTTPKPNPIPRRA